MTDFFTTPDGEGSSAERVRIRRVRPVVLDSAVPETDVVIRGRVLAEPMEYPKCPEACFAPPPTVEDEAHVLFDTEQVSAGGLYAQFFQNSSLTNTREPKVFGIDTNMIYGGSLTDGCEKDMREVRLLSDDLPPDTEFALQFIPGSRPWLMRRVKLGEWLSLEMCGPPTESVGGQIEAGEVKPITFRGSHCFLFQARMLGKAPLTERDRALDSSLEFLRNAIGVDSTLKGAQDALSAERNARIFRVRIEVRGAYRRPDYEAKSYPAWRNQRALGDIQKYGQGHGKAGHGLFDTDFVRGGVARLFSCTRMNSNGKTKQFGEDYNLVGNGGTLPGGWTKQVVSIEIETKIEGPLDIRLLLSGYEWLKAVLQEGGGNIRTFKLPVPLTLIEREHFTLEVKTGASSVERAEVRATLVGPLFVPASGE